MGKFNLPSAFFFAVLLMVNVAAFGWTNPMSLPGLEGRSLGDPYIMKYKGYYYLYVSAGDEKIYCWRTKDLVDWSDSFVCCTDPVTAVAYAPEVIYWNGKFYMCTSPRGGGHYMLTSDSPTGPFVHQSENLGRDIDGSMFVDNDGQWYFYHANNEGIRGCVMPTHLSYGDDVDLRCCMSGQWTEGPCVFNRNGLYYLIYTGNHVWTNGYRIDYAISDEGPLGGFVPQKEQNPILVDTQTPTHKALGHGTAFIGPDLDTYFFCYHNLQDNKRRRLLNFERIAWNGDKLIMTGPSDREQDRPTVAASDYFERDTPGDNWIFDKGGLWHISDMERLVQSDPTGHRTAIFSPCEHTNYTAEFTVRAHEGEKGRAGAIFSYKNPENYCEALINAADSTFEVNIYADGKPVRSISCKMPADFEPTAWHHLRVEKNGRLLRVYIDGMRKAEIETDDLTEGRTGYATRDCAADFSYIAVSECVDGNGILRTSFPLPGLMSAVHFTKIEGDAKSVEEPMRVGTCHNMYCGKGSRLTYNVNVRDEGTYNIGIRYKSDGSRIRVWAGDSIVADSVETKATAGSKAVCTIEGVELKGGRQQLAVEVVDGTIEIDEYIIRPGVRNPRAMSDDFENGLNGEWGYTEGVWTTTDGMAESAGGYGKILMGDFDNIHMTDYTVECDICYPYGEMNGGVLFRVCNVSTGGADDNPVLGTDFIQGYVFIADQNRVILGKHNFGWQVLAEAQAKVDPTTVHHMKVDVDGSTFRCYLDDMDHPLITYTDNDPFISGRPGLRAHGSKIRFDNFSVTPR